MRTTAWHFDTAAATDTLMKMGVSPDDMPFALDAAIKVCDRYGLGRSVEAAEFVGTVMAICGVHDVGVLLVPNILGSARKVLD